MRTVKSCGPDAPTLASSLRKPFRGRRWQKSPVTGEITKETVKTTARGMPDVSGVTVVTNACAFYQCARGCGRAERPAFPAPSDWGGRNDQAKPRAKHAREIAKLCLGVFARSEATKQSSFLSCGSMDCVASLAMTMQSPLPTRLFEN